MGTYISEQLAMFLRSILLGGALGLVYDLLRALRSLGGQVWGGLLDTLYCLLAVSSLFFFMMAGDGELRLFVLLGVFGGAVLFFCLLSRTLRPLWDFWLAVLLSPLRVFCGLLEKGLRICKKGFSFFRKKLTILDTYCRTRLGAARKEGDPEMGRTPAPKKSQKKSAAQKKKPNSKLTAILLAALLLGMGIQLSSLFRQLQTAQKEEAAYAERLAALQERNDGLRQDIENSGDLSLTKDIARDELGMVSPGEKIIHFNK